MSRATIIYHDAELSAPEFLVDLWPHDMHLEMWPTYCGAGDGLGDWIVPDKIRSANVRPACFLHDVDWALAPSRSAQYFVISNYYFWCNLRALVKVQLTEGTGQYKMALHLCNLYAAVVTCPLGWKNFQPEGTTVWDANPTVQQKLHRLAMASLV
jgi:hypothetical protein